MNLADLLRPLDSAFRRYRVRYAVIGGFAVAAWGEERATRGVDLLCGVGDSKAILDALNGEALHFEHRIGDSTDPISEVIRIDVVSPSDPYEIDVLIGIRNAPPDVLDRIRMVTLEGLAIPVASPEDIIILKLLGGSARDLEDAKSVVQIQGDKLDLKLIRQLCPAGFKEILEKLIVF